MYGSYSSTSIHVASSYGEKKEEYKRFRKRTFERNLIISILISFLILFFGSLIFMGLERWSFLTSIYFCSITLATVGYGDIVPKSSGGKLMLIFYSFISLASLGFCLTTAIQFYEEIKKRKEKEKNPYLRYSVESQTLTWKEKLIKFFTGETKEVVISFTLFSGLFTIMILVFAVSQEWSFLSALYFSTVTITTIGYGDLTVKTNSYIFVVIFVLIDVGLRVYIICVITERSQYLEKEKLVPTTSTLWLDSPNLTFRVLRRNNLNRILIFVIIFTLISLGMGTILFMSIETWNFTEALFFITCTVTTIGFDDLTPKDPRGRILLVLFALESLIIKFYVLSIINRKIAHKKLLSKEQHEKEGEEGNEEYFTSRSSSSKLYCTCLHFKTRFFMNRLFLTLVGTIILLLFSAIFFSIVEQWNFLDSLYFSTVIAATIGYGDLKIKTVPGEIGVVLLATIGQVILSFTISEIQDQSIERVNKKLKEKKSEFLPLLPISKPPQTIQQQSNK